MNKFPAAPLITLGMVIIFETLVAYFDIVLYSDINNGPMMKIKSELALVPEHNFDILFLGDCYNQTGIDPRIVDQLTGLSSFNFSTDAFHTVMSAYFTLKNYLPANTKKPRYLFIGFLPKVWTQKKEDVIQEYLFALANYKSKNTQVLIKEFGLVNTLKLYIPSLVHQSLLRVEKLSDVSWLWQRIRRIGTFGPKVIRYVATRRGVFLPYSWGYKISSAEPPEECGAPLFVSPFFKKYLKLILELSKENNIRVVYIIPAAPSSWAVHAEKCRSNQAIRDFLTELEDQYENFFILEPHRSLGDAKFYVNETHFNSLGAQAYSQYLAGSINQNEGRL